MNIEEKKLEQVLNRIKAIFDEEYNKDAEKVYWYLVAIHIMKSDRDVKYCVEAHSVRISDFYWDDDISEDYERECDIVKNVDVTLIYNLMFNDSSFWKSHYADIVNFIIDYYFSIDKLTEENTTPDEISKIMAYFVEQFGSEYVFDPCAGMCGIAFQPEMSDVNFQGVESVERIRVLADIKLSTLHGYKRCDGGSALYDKYYSDWYELETMVSDLPFGVKIDSTGLTIEDFVVNKFIETEDIINAVLMVSPSFVSNNISRNHKELINNGYVEKVITFPSCSYGRTSVNPVMLVLNKNRDEKFTTFVDARDCATKEGQVYKIDCDKVKERLTVSNSHFVTIVDADEIVNNNYSLNQVHYINDVYNIKPDEKLYKFEDVAMTINCESVKCISAVRTLTEDDFSSSLLGSLYADKDFDISEYDNNKPRIVSEPCVIANFTFSLYHIKKDYKPVKVPAEFDVYKINESLCLPEYFAYKMQDMRKNVSSYKCDNVVNHLPYIALYPLESQRQILARVYRSEKAQMIARLSRLNILSDKSSELLHNLSIIFSRIGSAAASIGDVKENTDLKTIDCNTKFAMRQINMTGADFSQASPILKKVNISELIEEYLDEWQLAGYKSFGTLESQSIPSDTKVKVDVDMFKSMMDCILINAHQHGFNRRYSADNTVKITTGGARIDNKLYVKIEIANNGNLFPDGMTLKDYITRGVAGINSSQDGAGGDHVFQIIHHFDGKMTIEQTSKWFSVILFIPVYLTSEDSNFYECDYEYV